jgi:gliding motility-associated-like protein
MESLKQKMDNLQIQPSKGLWDAIHQQNIQLGVTKSSSQFPAWVVGIASVLIIATVAYFFFQSNNIDLQDDSNILSTSATSKIAPTPLNELHSNTSLNTSPNVATSINKQSIKQEKLDSENKPNSSTEIIAIQSQNKVAIELPNNHQDILINSKSISTKPEVISSNELTESTIDERPIVDAISKNDLDTAQISFCDDPTVCFGEDASLVASEGYQYQWNTGEVSNKIIVSPLETSNYFVTVTNQSGMKYVHQFTVNVDNSCSALFVPSAFTPNGDARNDLFQVQGRGIQKLRLVILNKQGKIIFETNHIDQTWDGTYKGELLDADSYFYQANYTDAKGNAHVSRGQITLLR